MIDTHAHVHDPSFDADREAMLQRATAAGVTAIVTVGTDLADSERAVRTASAYHLYASIGIHPHEAKSAPDDVAAALDALIESSPHEPIAIGETGLDYYYGHSPRDEQRRVMEAQVAFARRRALPLIFHQRDAFDDFVSVLRAAAPVPPGVIHCFTGNSAQARLFVDEFGFKLGIGGVLTFKNADALREAVVAVGAEHVILETDCPYLAPMPHRGQRNEPAFIAQTATRLAELLSLEREDLIARTTATARRLFQLER